MLEINRLRSDAENGSTDAIVELGICYLKGKDIQKNRAEAVKLFRSATLKNNCEGMYNLGICLLKGQGCSINEEEALEVLQKAAELKDIKSMNFLGNFYFNSRNFEKAIYYYKSASDLKDSIGMQGLAALYMHYPEKRFEAKKLFYDNYIIMNNNPIEFISVLEKYEKSNLRELVNSSFQHDYLSINGECALLTIPSFSTPYIWEIVRNNNGLSIKQTVWNKDEDEEKIRNILLDDIKNGDIDIISRPFTTQPTIESSYLNVDSFILKKIINKLKEVSLPLNLIQDNYVICDGTMYKFKMGFSSSLELSWSTYLPKAWQDFDEVLSLLRIEAYKDPNALRE